MGLIAAGAGLTWFTLIVSALVYAEKLKKHRLDIGQHASVYTGRSAWLEVNLLSVANYDKEGQRKVRVLKLLMAAQILPMVVLLYLYML